MAKKSTTRLNTLADCKGNYAGKPRNRRLSKPTAISRAGWDFIKGNDMNLKINLRKIKNEHEQVFLKKSPIHIPENSLRSLLFKVQETQTFLPAELFRIKITCFTQAKLRIANSSSKK